MLELFVTQDWNGGAERMFGWTAEEVVGRPLTVIIPERFRQLHEDGIARVRRTGASRLAGQVVELSGLRRDGSEFPIEPPIGSWTGPDGVAFSWVLRDLTERKRAEADLAAANRELERSNAELETIVYSASHDLIGRLPVVTGDPVGFRQLFTNLLENAVRHGGRLDLVVAADGRPVPEGGVELSVRDNGRGIPREHRERVFGVFERLEGPSSSAGTGMGLAICRKIVEVLGGGIGIEGDRGTDVRIVLPSAVAACWPAQELTVGASR